MEFLWYFLVGVGVMFILVGIAEILSTIPSSAATKAMSYIAILVWGLMALASLTFLGAIVVALVQHMFGVSP